MVRELVQKALISMHKMLQSSMGCMCINYIQFKHAILLISWSKNLLVCSLSLSQDVLRQEAKYRISGYYLCDDDSGSIFS